MFPARLDSSRKPVVLAEVLRNGGKARILWATWRLIVVPVGFNVDVSTLATTRAVAYRRVCTEKQGCS